MKHINTNLIDTFTEEIIDLDAAVAHIARISKTQRNRRVLLRRKCHSAAVPNDHAAIPRFNKRSLFPCNQDSYLPAVGQTGRRTDNSRLPRIYGI